MDAGNGGDTTVIFLVNVFGKRGLSKNKRKWNEKRLFPASGYEDTETLVKISYLVTVANAGISTTLVQVFF